MVIVIGICIKHPGSDLNGGDWRTIASSFGTTMPSLVFRFDAPGPSRLAVTVLYGYGCSVRSVSAIQRLYVTAILQRTQMSVRCRLCDG